MVVGLSTVAPVYVVGSVLSALGTVLAVRKLLRQRGKPRSRRLANMLLLLTVFDLAYAVKFFVTAVSWYAGKRGDRRSFQLFDDDCLAASLYEHATGMAVVALNACWVFDFVCIVQNPLRNTRQLTKYYTLFVLLATITSTVVSFVLSHHSGASDSTCWVRSELGVAWAFEGPLYAFLVFAVCSLAFACCRLRTGTVDTQLHRASLRSRHAAFVVAFVVLWGFPLVHQLVDSGDDSTTIAILVAISTTIQAAVLAAIRLVRWRRYCCTSRAKKFAPAHTSSTGRERNPYDTLSPPREDGGGATRSVRNPIFPRQPQRGYGTSREDPTDIGVIVTTATAKEVPLLATRSSASTGSSAAGDEYSPPAAAPARIPQPSSDGIPDFSASLRLDLGVVMLSGLVKALQAAQDSQGVYPASPAVTAFAAVPRRSSDAPATMWAASNSNSPSTPTTPTLLHRRAASAIVSPSPSTPDSPRRRTVDLSHLLQRSDSVRTEVPHTDTGTQRSAGVVTAIADSQFAQLRHHAGLTADEVEKVLGPHLLKSGALSAHFSSAGSASFFCKSTDSSLILKTIPLTEVVSLVDLLPDYVRHLQSEPDSLLCRFYGCFSMKVHGLAAARIHFILMGNVLPLVKLPATARTYDLKGSTVGRGTKPPEGSSAGARRPAPAPGLRQDLAFRQDFPQGFHLPRGVATLVFAQLQRDVDLLAHHGLMDYSLLLSVLPVTTAPSGDDPVIAFPAHPYFPLSLGGAPVLPPAASDALLNAVSKTFARSAPAAAAGPTVLRWSPMSVHEGRVPAPVIAAPTTPQSPAFAGAGAAVGAVAGDTPVVLQFGVLDVLQPYNFQKRVERSLKVVKHRQLRPDISACDPPTYAGRFLGFMRHVFPEASPGPGATP